MKIEISYKKIQKYTNTWRLNNILLNNEWVNNKIKEEIKSYLEIVENENKTIQKSKEHSQSSIKRGNL